MIYNQTAGFYIFPVWGCGSGPEGALTVVVSLAQYREPCKDGDPRWWLYQRHPGGSIWRNLDAPYYFDPWGDRRFPYTNRGR